MNYTYEELREMRRLVKEEIAAEMRAEGLEQATTAYVSSGAAEDRLRTYMSAGVLIGDMKADCD